MKSLHIKQLQADVTDNIISQLERGVLPWNCPWQKDVPGLPSNYTTKVNYSGINTIILWLKAMEQGYSSNQWMTFKQAEAAGGKVKKGESGCRCIFYTTRVVEDRSEDGGDDKVVPVISWFVVFNLDQIEGLDVDLPEVDNALTDVSGYAMDYIQQYSSVQGILLSRIGDSAYYSKFDDKIVIPERKFDSPDDLASTLYHEAIHSTAHDSRLARFKEFSKLYDNSKEAYALEELVASFGEAFMCAEQGIYGEHLQHASYIDSWLQALRNNPALVFKAAAKASQAVDFIRQSVELRLAS